MIDSLLGRKSGVRLLAILFAGLIVVGAGMIVSSLKKRSFKQPDSAVQDPHSPDWIRRSPLKEYFTNYLQTIEPTSPIASLIRVYLMSLSRSQFNFASAHAEFRMTRTLPSSHEFESSAVLNYKRLEEAGEIELHVVRSEKEPFTCRAVLGEGAIVQVDFGDAGNQVEMPNTNLLHSLPIGLGDLQLADLMAFYQLLGSGSSITPIGYLEAKGTERLLVLEMDFPPPADPVPAAAPDSSSTSSENAGSFSGIGASALVYIHPKSYTLRRALIFDEADRLVRIYEDFAYKTNERNSPIESFRVTSLVTNSHTIFRLDQLTLNK